jgi:hypothetical protein
MRTIILLIVFTGSFPGCDWMWLVACVWYILSCAKWWLGVWIDSQ